MITLSSEQKRRYEAFWNREPTDRACLYLTAWDGSSPFSEPRDDEQRWCDLDYREAKTLYEIEHTRYFAEGFPTVFTNFGPGNLAACVGGSFKPAKATVWFENQPYFVSEWEGRPSPVLNRESRMYRLVEAFSERLLSHGDKFFTSICDIGGTFDIIASLRGTENLLYDLLDDPDEVKSLCNEIAPIWKRYYLEQSARLLSRQGCMTSWQPIYSELPYYPLQCDFSAMISPDMFREFVLPDLREQTEYMDRSIYHLDGVGEIPHVDLITSLPRLSAIQWVPGDGKPNSASREWFDLIRRIQKAGKGVILLGADPALLEELFRNVPQTGIYIQAEVRDKKEADEIVSMAKKLNSR